MNDSDDIVRQGMLAKFLEMGAEHAANIRAIEGHKSEIKRLEERQADLSKKAEGLISAASLFDFDLLGAYQAKKTQADIPIPTPDPAPQVGPSSRPSIKNTVLRTVQTAYPKPVRAAAIRAELAALGEVVHEKTVGMTLYRLLKKGLLRREGFDWYFVPENERTAQEEGADA